MADSVGREGMLPALDAAVPVCGNSHRPSLSARAMWRLLRTGLHLTQGLATVAVAFPLVSAQTRLSLKRRWSIRLLAILGVRLNARISAIPPGAMLVANHVSWIDVFAINAVVPASFVAKADVRDWPLIGWLCEKTGNLFLERGSRKAAARANESVRALLAQGRHVAAFPEGTTTNGRCVLPFHAALVQPAIDAGAAVVPVCLRYLDGNGEPTDTPAYAGETTLWESIQRIASARGIAVDVWFGAPVAGALGQAADRRQMATRAREVIAQRLFAH